MQQHRYLTTATFTVPFSTGYLARDCQPLLNNFRELTVQIPLSPWGLFPNKPVFPTEPRVTRAGQAGRTEARQPPAPVPRAAPSPPPPLGPEPRPPAPLPGTATRDPHRILTEGLSGGRRGRQRRPVPAAEHCPVRRMQRRRRKRPGCGRKRPGHGRKRGLHQFAAYLSGARPLAARRDACAGRALRGLREGRGGGGGERRSAPAAAGLAGGERSVAVRVVCFMRLLADCN